MLQLFSVHSDLTEDPKHVPLLTTYGVLNVHQTSHDLSRLTLPTP